MCTHQYQSMGCMDRSVLHADHMTAGCTHTHIPGVPVVSVGVIFVGGFEVDYSFCETSEHVVTLHLKQQLVIFEQDRELVCIGIGLHLLISHLCISVDPIVQIPNPKDHAAMKTW